MREFDPGLRRQLGIWYTPREIVHYQVERVDRLLREELGIPDGFADSKVIVLDPCAGTGSYLLEVLGRIKRTLEEKGLGSTIGLRLKEAVCGKNGRPGRVFGFEILMAPFVISHMQTRLVLRESGAEPLEEERTGVYLTNALTGWDLEPTRDRRDRKQTTLMAYLPALKDEREASSHVKIDENVLVILGNPPYNRYAGVAEAEEADLIEPYKQGLYEEWGVRKQLLDDLYIRFYRLGERRIAEVSGRGVISFISNSSWLDGISHPIMREHLISAFDAIWIDNLNGDKYRTGKVIPKGLPKAGSPDQSIFTTTYDPEGIQVGTAIGTLVKTGRRRRNPATVRYKDYWGHSDRKRKALTESLTLSPRKLSSSYKKLEPRKSLRWVIAHTGARGEYETWIGLPSMFRKCFCGLNENRGGALIAFDRKTLETRMSAYYDAEISERELTKIHPGFTTNRARYDSEGVRLELLKTSSYNPERIIRLHFKPMDVRYVYWEEHGKLINEKRPEYFANLIEGNLFLACSQRSRKGGWNLPSIVDGMGENVYQDPWSQFYPLFVKDPETGERRTNLNASVLKQLAAGLGIDAFDPRGRLTSDGYALAHCLFHHILAILHAPAYRHENEKSLIHDWPRIPLPTSRGLLVESAKLGQRVAALFLPSSEVIGINTGQIGAPLSLIGVPSRIDSQQLDPGDLLCTIRYTGTGRWEERDYTQNEKPDPGQITLLGESTGDLYWNDVGYWRNVPKKVWEFKIGGYPVVKKWLTYRHADDIGRALTLDEIEYVQEMIRRIASLLLVGTSLDENYRRVIGEAHKNDRTSSPESQGG